jgi:O-antigen/teichoic acid export membrane protein
MKRLRKHKSIISYLLFSIANSVLGFVAALVSIRLIPPNEFARIALFLSVQFIAIPLVSFSADSLIGIKKARLDCKGYEYFRRSYVTFAYIMFVVMQGTFILLYITRILQDKLLLLIPFYGIVRFLITIASTEYIIEEKSVKYGAVTLSTTLTSLLLSILLLSQFSGIADFRIAALLLADILFLYVRYRRRMRLLWTFTFDKAVFKDVINFGFPLLLSVAPAWALNESDKIIVAQYVDMTSLGYYAAACTIGSIMITFNTAMLNAFTPKIYAALSRNPKAMFSIVKRSILKFLAAAAAFGVFFITAYWLTADLILPEKYISARHIVYVVIVFSLARSIYSVLGLVTDFYEMTITKLRGVIYGGATTVAVAFLGVVEFGVIGAAIGVGSGYLVLSLRLWLALKNKAKTL